MEQSGIIEPSSSSWASPIVLVKKKDALFVCVLTIVSLTACLMWNAYPMLRIDNLINHLGGARFITTLDLTQGYWQVPVFDVDCPKTAFTTPFGLFQFWVMPFGLQGAPGTFQRMMD